MKLETPADVARYLIHIYKSELSSKNIGHLFNSVIANGICRAIDHFAYYETVSPFSLMILKLSLIKRIDKSNDYLCVTPLHADSYSELIYAYQARISLLEEILIEVTPVDKEEELGTFEKFNNILY